MSNFKTSHHSFIRNSAISTALPLVEIDPEFVSKFKVVES